MDTLFDYGPIRVISGKHKGRIGYFDDTNCVFSTDGFIEEDHLGSSRWEEADDDNSGERSLDVAIVYFSERMWFTSYEEIPFDYIEPVTTDDLISRREDLAREYSELAPGDSAEAELRILHELHLVDTLLVDRMILARFTRTGEGSMIFISHCSHDKQFARWIGTDLKSAGYEVWFDEWNIKVGEQIPEKISEGLAQAEYVLVVLSDHSVNSKWVEREWQNKYWDEVREGTIKILPVLFRDCIIPELLKTKKYADFRTSYNDGFTDILACLQADGSK